MLKVRDPFTYEILEEGLIKSVDISTAITSLENKFGKNFNVPYINTDGFVITVDIKINRFAKGYSIRPQDYRDYTGPGLISNIIKLANNLGYFPSYINTFYNDSDMYNKPNYSDKYSPKNMEDALYGGGNILQIRFEKKFDDIVDVLPKYIYHITEDQFINRIHKIGMTPKSLKRRSDHPDRIYFALDIDALRKFWLKIMITMKPNIERILKINTEKLNVTFYSDPNFINGGIYTYENIPKNAIEFLDLNQTTNLLK